MTIPAVLIPRRSPLRWLMAAAAVTAAAAHIPVIGPHLEEAPYMGVLFILLTIACLMLATAAILYDAPAVYLAAAITCGLTIVGYAATRLVAFPMLADDVGNWMEPLGVVSIIAEAIVVACSIAVLWARRAARAHRAVGIDNDLARIGEIDSLELGGHGADVDHQR
ncbi:MAG TPA: hypothetical protein VI030_02980 [Propionibacteriaceae bacterium]